MDRLTTDFARIQLSFTQGWITVILHMWQGWQHLLKTNYELFQHPALHRGRDIRPTGADWMDHYGKRCHDVDIEHLR